jgi:hypothetical protein
MKPEIKNEIKSATDDDSQDELGTNEGQHSELEKEEVKTEDTVWVEVKKEEEADMECAAAPLEPKMKWEESAVAEIKQEQTDSEYDDRQLAAALEPEIKLEESELEIKQEVSEDDADDMEQDSSLGCQSER